MSFIKNYGCVPVNFNEIRRYAGCKDLSADDLINECLKEATPLLTYRVCYDFFPVKESDKKLDLGFCVTDSADLKKNLSGSNRCVLFGATVGIGIDRLIKKYGAVSPSKAVVFQAIGAERVESLCDLFCKDLKSEFSLHLKPRFSFGYGDLPLSLQREVFNALKPQSIGLTLNDSLIMSPSKSVTAVIGNCGKESEQSGCRLCDSDCEYRR